MPKRKIAENPSYLDDEERTLIESVDLANAKIPSGKAWEKRKRELAQIAANTANPPKVQISARLSKYDLAKLKTIAMQMGIPYQTLLGSIVHQYVEGRFDKNS